ncbi:MAG: gamma-glutamylcyclotransferase family protein [Actinomycetota bacterium]
MGTVSVSVFVYGTLKPGHLRWPMVAPFVDATEAAEVEGRLWDTGNDFPAARFGPPGRIRGVLLHLKRDCEDEAIRLLDEVEGEFLYRRAQVRTADGRAAVAYEWRGATDAFIELDGVWDGV